MRPTEDDLKAWMIAGLDGDAAAHAALLGALVPILRRYYGRRSRAGEHDIEDLVQETLIAVHIRRPSFDRDRPFTAWLFAIARYKLVDQFRRTRLTCPVEEIDDILVAEGFETQSHARMDVDRLLAALPAKQADAIRRTRLDGLSVTEAAAASGRGESDIKVSVHRGLKALAHRLLGARP